MKKQAMFFMLGILILFSGIERANAALIFDNFGTPPGYKTSGAVGFLIGPNTRFDTIVNVAGTRFVPSATSSLNSFDVPVWNHYGDETTTMTFYLGVFDEEYSNPTIMETFSVSLGASGTMNAYTLYSDEHPLLNAGEEYWVVASSPDAVAWLYTTSADTSAQVTSYNGGTTWQTYIPEPGDQLALRVDGSPVPVPAAVWLLGIGLLPVAGFRRRKK